MSNQSLRMILVVREWSGPIRSYLLRNPWDCNLREKLRWIKEMDHDDNWNAQVQLDHEQKVVEMNIDRKNEEVEFSAGKRIRVRNFEEFSQLFYSAEDELYSSEDE